MRPYKRNFGNNVDVLILAMLEALAIFLLLVVYFHLTAPTLCCYSLVVIPLLCVPHMVLILYICYKLVNKLGIIKCLKTKGRLLKRCVLALRPPTQALEAETNTGSLPDWLVNPGEYEPLLPTTEQHTAAGTTVNKDLINK